MQRRLKTKTFTGCWTCRKRKVKCDTGRPSCGRCAKANLACGGYDIELYWVTSDDIVPASAIKHRAMLLQGHPISELRAMNEIEQLIAAIDEIEPSVITSEIITFGPFAIFRSTSGQISQLDPTAANDQEDLLPTVAETSFDSEPHSMNFSVMDFVAYDTGPSPLDFTVFPVSGASCLGSYSSSAFAMRMLEERKTVAVGMSQVLKADQSLIQNIPAELTLSLRQSPLAVALIDNYRRNVAPLLLPYFRKDNPYSSIYVPKALVGAASILSTKTNIYHQTPPGNVAIFYALLATSSFHMRRIKDEGRGGQFDVLGRFFRDKAFQYLRQAISNMENRMQATLESGDMSATYTDPIMGAMLSLVTIDVMEGSMGEFWIHLDGARKRQGQVPWGRLHTLCTFLLTVSDTTEYNLATLAWPRQKDDLERYYLQQVFSAEDDCCLETTYGITSELLFMMRLTTTLSQHVAYYMASDLPIPQALEAACKNLESGISNWSIETVSLPSVAQLDHVACSIIKLHIEAFHTALRIYFNARVFPCTEIQMTEFVDTVAEKLGMIENLKTSHGGPLMASIMWPGFVAACEATSSQRGGWQAWWQHMLRYCIGNIATLWQVVQDVWKARDAGNLETPRWIGVLRANKQKILAI